MSRRRPSNGAAARAQLSTLVITNLGKIVGIAGGIAEWLRPGPAQDSVLMFCAVLVVGAEAMERIVTSAIRNLLARDEQ